MNILDATKFIHWNIRHKIGTKVWLNIKKNMSK
jgi:hypothetical protein